eukprot:COSAG01_NODE_12032_length_1812_cov_0.988908_2_plen_302_part_01
MEPEPEGVSSLQPDPEEDEPDERTLPPAGAGGLPAGHLPDADVEHSTEIVGRGGSGIVCKGTYTQRDGTKVPVAIKELVPGADTSVEHRLQHHIMCLTKEFSIAHKASKKCPRACKMYGCVRRVDSHGTTLCLVMKLYPQSLLQYLEKRRDSADSSKRVALAVDEAMELALQIAEGLEQLHAEGITVADLKPSNVLMDEHGQLVISDFGLARMEGGSTIAATLRNAAGTSFYMGPEIWDEDENMSEKSDLWSFACLVIEMLTGAVPWAKEDGIIPTQQQIMANVLVKKLAPKIPPGLPRELE